MTEASRRASLMPAAARRRHPSSSIDPSVTRVSGIELLLPTGHAECIHQLVQVTVHHVREIVHRQIDAMVGDATLWIVVGPDLGRPVAGTDHGPPLMGARGLLF